MSRFVLLLFVAMLGSPSATAAQGHAGGGGLPVSETFTFPAGERRIAIPFTNSGGHVVIPMVVNGGPTLHMVLDTGMPSPGVLLYEGTLADSIAFEWSPMRIKVGGAGSERAAEARLATGVELEVGGLRIGGSVAIVMPPTPEMSQLHDGIVGATFFQNLVVTIDQDRHELVLEQREGFTPLPGATEVPLDLSGRIAYVPVGLVGPEGKVTPLRLVLDIGAMHAVSLNRHANPAIVVPLRSLATRIGRGMGGAMTGRVGRVAGIELGGHRLNSVVATFPDSAFENPRGLDSREGNLGIGALSRFTVTFDYAKQRMFVRPNARFQEPFEWDMSGVIYDPGTDGRPVIASVVPGSPAALAGIEAGDVLIAVDGQSADPRALMRDRDRFREAGRELVLRVRRAGVERDIKLKLKRMV